MVFFFYLYSLAWFSMREFSHAVTRNPELVLKQLLLVLWSALLVLKLWAYTPIFSFLDRFPALQLLPSKFRNQQNARCSVDTRNCRVLVVGVVALLQLGSQYDRKAEERNRACQMNSALRGLSMKWNYLSHKHRGVRVRGEELKLERREICPSNKIW